MNKMDRNNLEFFLTSDSETLHDWFETASVEDRAYAIKILSKFQDELNTRLVMTSDQAVTDLRESAEVLKKFLL